MKNFYATLEVPPGSDAQTIRGAYRRLAQEKIADEAAFVELTDAFETLIDPARRGEYDRALFGPGFAPTPLSTAKPLNGARKPLCPMSAGAQCPVVNSRVPISDTYCPECGFRVADIPAEGFASAGTGGFPSLESAGRLEEKNGRMHTLRPGVNTVGREAADVLLPDKTVSRLHAQIAVSADGAVVVEDLGSTNGTEINAEPLPPNRPRVLADGDRVDFGSVSLTFWLPDSADATPQSVVAGKMTIPPAASPPLGRPLPREEPKPADVIPEEPASEQKAHAPDTAALATMTFVPQGTPLARLIGRRGAVTREHTLVQGVTTFGRRPDSTIVIQDDPYVSGNHAQIIAEDNAYRLTDVGSSNGTFVNGERLAPNEPRTLELGDEVMIGGMAYRFEPPTVPVAEGEEPEETV